MEENMDDQWICIDDDDDDVSSSHSFSDSDKMDSETEAELYSKIHYEENLSNTDCLDAQNVSSETPQLFIYAQDEVNNVFYMDKQRESSQALAENIFPNDMDLRQKLKKYPDRASVVRMSEPHLDSAKKQKGDFEESSLCSAEGENTNQSSKHKLNNKQNQTAALRGDKRYKSSKKSDIVVIDSSDSDSNFVWSEQDSHDINEMAINMINDSDQNFDSDIICLSSDSDSDKDTSFPVIKRSSILRNRSMPNIKIGDTSEDLWNINSEDLFRCKRSSRRYHDSSDITCSNCNKKGHAHRSCPSPKVIRCFVCGGDHAGARCARRICSNCFAAGHCQRKCWKRPNDSFCCLCNTRGHTKETCPDLWRRYHLSTDSINIQKGKKFKQTTYLYCWNCGKGGHFGAECPRLESSKYAFGTWPCVISYSCPKNLLKKRVNILENRQSFKRSERPQNDGNVSAHFSNKKNNSYFKPKMQPNVDGDRNFTNMQIAAKKEARKRHRINREIKKTERLLKQNDFPRTPKKPSPQKSVDDVPEVMNSEIRRKQKRFQRKQKRKLNRLMKIREQQKHNLQNVQSIH